MYTRSHSMKGSRDTWYTMRPLLQMSVFINSMKSIIALGSVFTSVLHDRTHICIHLYMGLLLNAVITTV